LFLGILAESVAKWIHAKALIFNGIFLLGGMVLLISDSLNGILG
jgi:hypothetical protein